MLKLAAAIATLTLLTALAGCGGDDSTEVSGEGTAALRTPAGASALQAQFERIVQTVSPEVVQLECGHRLGSGVVFDGRGNVVTNAHVVGKATGCTATLTDGDEHSASVVGAARTNDLAVVHLSGAMPKPATLADSSEAEIGDVVLAMGNPLGLGSSVTQGIVSALDRRVQESNNIELSPLIQTSAEINPGNSGGALVDLSGRVIGIPTLTALDPEFDDAQAPGIGFAIPSNTVRSVAARLLSSN
jgi:putative serine protease PepD